MTRARAVLGIAQALAAGAIVLGGGIVLASALSAALATGSVARVGIEGVLDEAERAAVRRAVAQALRAPGLRMTGDIAAALEALGWVRQARVRRLWPDTLHVAIDRETLSARWGEAGYLTTAGAIVPAPGRGGAAAQRHLPLLDAAHASGPEAMRIFALLQREARTAGLAIGRLDQDRAGGWRAHLAPVGAATADGSGSLAVALGKRDLARRMQRFIAVYRTALAAAGRGAAHADARYDTGVAIRWRDGAPPRGADARLIASAATADG